MAYPAEKNRNFTYQDYVGIDDGNRYELLEGDLIMVLAPTTVHQRILGEIGFVIKEFVVKNNLGEIFYAPCDVYFDEETVLQPDILYISKERQDIITEPNIKGAPDLTIEIISTSSAYYDLVKKKKIYAAFGVKEYWIVDPKEKTVEVYNLADNEYNLLAGYKENDTLTSPVFPGLNIELPKIF